MDTKRKSRATARSGAHEATSKSTKKNAPAMVQKQKAKSSSKRKRDDDADRMPRKKAALDNAQATKGIQSGYRESKGVRKSKRVEEMAAAKALELLAESQNVQVESDKETPSEVQPDTPVASRPPAASTEGVAHESGYIGTASVDMSATDRPSRLRRFLEVLASNVSSHKIVRRLVDGYNKFISEADEYEFARDGVLDLEAQIWDEENDADGSVENLEAIRSRHAERKQQLDEVEESIRVLKDPIRDLNEQHSQRNNRIYEFMDIDRGNAELQCLPKEFWAAFDSCSKAYTARKDIELDFHVVEQEQKAIFEKVDAQVISAVCDRLLPHPNGGLTPQATTFSENVAVAEARISALGTHTVMLERLDDRLDDAMDAQYRKESTLNQIAEDAFVAAGCLRADNDVEHRELHLFLSRKPLKNQERYNQECENQELPEPDPRSEYRAAKRRQEAGLVSRVAHARKKLNECRRKLDESRWRPISNVGSMDSDAQGNARARRMNRRTQELRSAEIEYKSILHRAQDASAINESEQSSNFRNRFNDGYRASTLMRYGYPMAEKRKREVDDWMSGIDKRTKERPVDEDAVDEGEKEGAWVDRYDSMIVGEDPETRDDTRLKVLIARWQKECEEVRGLGPFEQAENDFHPKSNSKDANGDEPDQSQ